jgi:hypothetical protein
LTQASLVSPRPISHIEVETQTPASFFRPSSAEEEGSSSSSRKGGESTDSGSGIKPQQQKQEYEDVARCVRVFVTSMMLLMVCVCRVRGGA